MGLAGLKNRRKISKDPNNTAWSKNTESFGHKMLRSHGWEPGQYLGAQDAPHAELHTAANASHIRVLLKDDNLGIGARRNQGDECTGLAVFKDLLGRLNGKSEATIQKEQKVRQDAQMSAYMHHKYGPMRFVKGGLLVGDKIEELVKMQATEVSIEKPAYFDTTEDKPRKEKKSKKRKAEAELEPEDSEEISRKEKKKRRKDMSTEENTPVQTDEDEVAEARRAKKEKKRRKKEAKAEAEANETEEPEAQSKSDKKRKTEKLREPEDSTMTSEAASEAEPSSTPHLSRHLARRKFIAQKRRAVMDPQALKQIFMIKT